MAPACDRGFDDQARPASPAHPAPPAPDGTGTASRRLVGEESSMHTTAPRAAGAPTS